MNPIYKFELNRESVNLLDPSAMIAGRILDPGNGAFDVDSNYQTTETRIAVTPGTTYAIKDNNNNAVVVPVVVFYEPDGSYSYGSTNVSQVTIPSDGIGYIRFSFPITVNARNISFAPSSQSYTPYLGPVAYPIYKDDLAKDFEKESNQEFFRAKLSGKLTFQSLDYDWIVGRVFDFQFIITVYISYDAGQTWTQYWRGTFWKTDCEFDNDAKTVVVQPTVWDQYNDVLAGMDKEYNLIELTPEIVPVKADKRPMIQVYVPGQSVIGCFLSGMWWEQECDIVNEGDTIDVGGNVVNKLTDYLHYSKNKVFQYLGISGSMNPQLPEKVVNEKVGNNVTTDYFDFTVGDYRYSRYQITNFDGIAIYNASTGMAMWVNTSVPRDLTGNYTVELSPVTEQGATGTVTLNIQTFPVYARYICDVLTVSGNNTNELPADDQTDNKNYKRVIGYYDPSTIVFSTQLVSTPTQWGIYQPGMYYAQPSPLLGDEFFPVARNAWSLVSIWFTFSAFDWIVEESGRQPFTIRHAYPIASVISVLLAKIAPGITHEATTDYSQFLYGTNLIGITQTLLITPKSNIVTAGYDQPAQKAPITLKNVTDMLRDCFRCYWFIDDQNRFRVEHIQYFRNGGSYSGSPVVGIDLTTQQVSRNGKAWAFARDQYKFDKPEMAARYQFGWMDDVTQLFDGYPIDIISKYVNPDNIEQIDISKFTSDIDYILLNPGEISKDGFVLLAGVARKYTNTFSAVVGTQFNERVYMDISVGERLDVYISPTGVFEDNKIVAHIGSQDVILFAGTINTINVESAANSIQFVRAGSSILRSEDVTIIVTRYSEQELPYENVVVNNADHYLQNAYVAFCILQQYYVYDMPAYRFEINGVQMYAYGIKKLKNQSIKFPLLTDPDMLQLVKTNLGNGNIQKLSVNLSSRNANATLKYDTE